MNREKHYGGHISDCLLPRLTVWPGKFTYLSRALMIHLFVKNKFKRVEIKVEITNQDKKWQKKLEHDIFNLSIHFFICQRQI
jgi:hypothetical protein